jgi:phage repressor protein C with HTH and peptisase S24 domain
MAIPERFRELRKELNFTQTEYGKLFDLSQDAISAIETGKNNPTIDVMTILHDQFNVNLEWLILGKDPMFNQKSVAVSTDMAYEILKDIPADLKRTETMAIISVSNGNPEQTEAICYLTVSRMLVHMHPRDKLRAFRMEGDSMQPYINPNDYIVYVEDYNPGVDGVYVLNRDNNLLVKRVFFKNNGSVLLYSENEKYPTEEVPQSEIKSINFVGKMILKIQKA